MVCPRNWTGDDSEEVGEKTVREKIASSPDSIGARIVRIVLRAACVEEAKMLNLLEEAQDSIGACMMQFVLHAASGEKARP